MFMRADAGESGWICPPGGTSSRIKYRAADGRVLPEAELRDRLSRSAKESGTVGTERRYREDGSAIIVCGSETFERL